MRNPRTGSKPRVYLAGPITGLSYKGAVNWREGTKAVLAPDIEAMSPMRAKDNLRNVTRLTSQEYKDGLMSTQKAIVARDRYDTTGCDMILMNLLGAERISIGSMIELGWADAARTPIVLAMEDDNVHDHLMVKEMAGYRVNTLEEAIFVCRSVLLP